MNEHCTQCRGTGKVQLYHPAVFDTDSAEEVRLAYDMASGPCPLCAKADRIRAAKEAVVQAAREWNAPPDRLMPSIPQTIALQRAVRALEEAEKQ